MVMLDLTDNFFLSYRGEPRRMYIRKKKSVKCKTTLSLVLFPLVVVHIVIYCAALPY